MLSVGPWLSNEPIPIMCLNLAARRFGLFQTKAAIASQHVRSVKDQGFKLEYEIEP